VSNYHAYADEADHFAAASIRAPIDVLRTLGKAVATSTAALRTAVLRRWTQRRLTRLSDHMLRDFGFERDWDGTIRSIRDAG
jgi:hypothetical protein